MGTNVRVIEDRDASDWAALKCGHRTFHKQPKDSAAVGRTCQWLRRGQHGVVGLVADEQGTPIAPVTLRWFAPRRRERWV
ncbi:hypothetical protein EDF64_12025 [Curtobacterium flaccumfaciens]|uniref:GNAT family N-acetyltransferase n=1 Tax=Curtobacterium flaccumfaciens TaxID=2035 RepID=A0A4R6DB06_9MICO|nr:hypothetical protein EDF64_12025 [Curtobacterium flaccumfaciens]